MSENSSAKVLLIDDEAHVRKLIMVVLRQLECEVVGEADNGETAVRLFKELEPDIVFLDINMPVKDGRETLREIIAYDPDAIVIMLTSLSDTETIKTCATLGASDYIRKDTPIDELQQLFQNLLQDFSFN